MQLRQVMVFFFYAIVRSSGFETEAYASSDSIEDSLFLIRCLFKSLSDSKSVAVQSQADSAKLPRSFLLFVAG